MDYTGMAQGPWVGVPLPVCCNALYIVVLRNYTPKAGAPAAGISYVVYLEQSPQPLVALHGAHAAYRMHQRLLAFS